MHAFRVESLLPPAGGCEFLEAVQRHDDVHFHALHESLPSRGLADGVAPEAGARAVVGNESCDLALENLSRKEKRKELKKLKRSRNRQQAVLVEKAAEEIRLADPLEQARIQVLEQQEAEALIREQAEHERQERLWLEREERARQDAEKRREEELARKQEEEAKKLVEEEELEEGWEYVEDGPAEIIWQGNEIIVKKSKKKVRKAVSGSAKPIQSADLPYSNPLPPQVTAFAAQQRRLPATSGYDGAEHSRNFGTEQDKTNCPFHIKTGVCRFGVSCSRAHVYPEKSCTLLVRNMYNGPGLAWEHEDGLEHTEEEVYEHFETFYDDVHEEFQKFGELVNFKVCRNGSSHLRGNVYAHYRSEEDAVSAYVTLNGRYYASKQISCEFVGVTRWRVAICGEYMKAHYKPCSRGTVCNFLHCFRNPRGEYTWADWDLPAPRSWRLEMNQLFGCKLNHIAESPDDEEYRRRPETEERRHRSRDKHEHHSRRHRSSDGSSDDGRAEKSRGKRKPRLAHTSDWDMDTVGQDSSGTQYNGDRKVLDERRDRFEGGSRSHRKQRHWTDDSGEPLKDSSSDSEEDNCSRRPRKRWAPKHRSEQAYDDDIEIHSQESGGFARATNGYDVEKQPSHSGSRHEDIRAERAKGHSHRSHLNTSSAMEAHRRASRYSDSESEGHKSKHSSRTYHNASNSEEGRSRNGHGSERKAAYMSRRRMKQEASYYDEKDGHAHRHKHRRSSSHSPISNENFSEAAEQKRVESSTAHSGTTSGDSEAENRLPPTGIVTIGLRQSSASVKRSSRTKSLQPSQEKAPDKDRRPRGRMISPSAKRTHSTRSCAEMSSKGSYDLDDRWGR